jgi:biopolymer transport protein ExbB
MNTLKLNRKYGKLGRALLVVLVLAWSGTAQAWWDGEWSGRKKLTLNVKEAGVRDAVGTTPVLIRLFEGNFSFSSAKEDGSDLRFVAADDKTLLTYHIEKYDSLMGEAFVWVKVPDLKPGEPTSLWLYYGNEGPKATRVDDAKGTYDADSVLVYHFSDNGAPAVDATGSANSAQEAGKVSTGSMIGGGLLLDGKSPVTVPASASLAWTAGGTLTWSAWIKPSSLQSNAVLFSRREEGRLFLIGVDNGIPYVEVNEGTGGIKRSTPGTPVEVNTWRHLAVTAQAGRITLWVNGESSSALEAGLPALNSPLLLGGDKTEGTAKILGFNGEMDELEISKIVRSPAFLKATVTNQGGGEPAGKLLQFVADEVKPEGTGGKILEHLMLFGDISKSMMFDGWMVIFFCGLMSIVGWTVAIRKFLYLNKIKKGTEEFLRQWKEVSSDLTALDHSDATSVSSLGGAANAKAQRLMKQSPLYHIYHIGSEEIRTRLQSRNGFNGLSSRSIQAIKASLDSGLTREVHRLNGGLIYLTISIAGGPYLGLLGTVMGVMITFAVIAKSGEVEVNSIAPGIAGALLATVAGLLVAIPALFIYSFLNSQIKDAVTDMQLFIDEFIAKMAEFYPPSSEGSALAPRAEWEQEESALR